MNAAFKISEQGAQRAKGKSQGKFAFTACLRLDGTNFVESTPDSSPLRRSVGLPDIAVRLQLEEVEGGNYCPEGP